MKKKNSTTTITNFNLIIDYGNTLVKAAIFDNHDLVELIVAPDLEIFDIENLEHQFLINSVILSAVRNIPDAIRNYFEKKYRFIELSHKTPVPITNLYKTPETLGLDRLALVVAGHYLFPDQHVLVIDAGTCITFDFVDVNGKYYGGGISPGIQMRFKALNTFTARLPLLKSKKIEVLSGATTEESILSGVLNGVVAEIDGIITKYLMDYPELSVVITGGDVDYFAEKLKSNIFAAQNLVLKGLNIILHFNVEKESKRI